MKLPALAVTAVAVTALLGGTAFAQATMQPIPNPPGSEKSASMHHGGKHHHGHHGHHHHGHGHHHHHHGMKGHKGAKADAGAAPTTDTTAATPPATDKPMRPHHGHMKADKGAMKGDMNMPAPAAPATPH